MKSFIHYLTIYFLVTFTLFSCSSSSNKSSDNGESDSDGKSNLIEANGLWINKAESQAGTEIRSYVQMKSSEAVKSMLVFELSEDGDNCFYQNKIELQQSGENTYKYNVGSFPHEIEFSIADNTMTQKFIDLPDIDGDMDFDEIQIVEYVRSIELTEEDIPLCF